MKRFILILTIFLTLLMQGFVNAQETPDELTTLQKVRQMILSLVPDAEGLENTNSKVDSLNHVLDSLKLIVDGIGSATSSGNPDSLNNLPGSAYMQKNDSTIFASRFYTDQQLLTKAASNHNHSGVYEPIISKETGYLRWNGTSWGFINETYSLSSHNHSGVYEPVLVSGTNIKTINGNSLLGSGDLTIAGGSADSLTFATQYDLAVGLAALPSGSGTSNQISYWTGTKTLGSLNTSTYPSLTELSYVKGLSSSVQTQLSARLDKAFDGYPLEADIVGTDLLPVIIKLTGVNSHTTFADLPISNATQTALNGKQETLVSGTNIKTVNSQSLLGSGNINITGFDSIAVVETAQALIDTTGDQLSYTAAEMDSLLLLAGQVPALQDSIASFRTILNSILTALDTCGCGANISDNTPPLPPSSYVAIGGTSQTQYVTTWTDPTALDLDSLRWYEGSSNDTTTWNWIASITAGVETYTRTGRSAGTTYWSGVKAVDDSGNVSWFSNIDSATTQSAPSGSEEMEVTRWKAGLSLNDSTINHINNFVVMLKDTFALDSLSEMWNVILVQANENPLSSLHNLVKRSNDADTNLTMEWTPWEGWNGDRTDNFNDGYINLNYNPYSDAGITTKDDFSISVFMRQDYDASGLIDAGVMIAATSDTGQIHFTIRRDDNEMGFRVNDLSWASPLFYNTGVDSSAGLYTITRSASDRFCYKNNTLKYTDNVASQSFPNKTMLMFRNQSSSTPDPSGMNSPKQTSFLLIGKHLSLSQHRSLFNICKAFLQGIGKDVTTY